MGKKREPSINDSLTHFKDVMRRASLSNYQYVNHNVLCTTGKDVKLLIHFDQLLWNAIMDDEEIKDQFKELDISKENDRKVADQLKYLDEIEEGWIDINPELLYNGEMIQIKIDGFDYKIPINKTIYPIRFKKAEYNNFGYKIKKDPLILLVKKKFEGAVDDSSFTIMRGFNII